MSKKTRYRFKTSFDLKKTHSSMMKNFEVRDVSSNKTKHDGYHMFFSVKSVKEETRIIDHFNKIGIELTKV